jgi:hypothetical protein
VLALSGRDNPLRAALPESRYPRCRFESSVGCDSIKLFVMSTLPRRLLVACHEASGWRATGLTLRFSL